jgi:hypothetical protein
MAYASDIENPISDVYMDEYTFSNEMLGVSLGSSKANDGTALNFASPRLATSNVSKADLDAAMQSILDIFQLSEDSSEQDDEEEVDENDDVHEVDMDEQNRRTEQLRAICPALDRLWWSGSDFMTGAAEKLADGSRDSK